jgi:hypothetical protein
MPLASARSPHPQRGKPRRSWHASIERVHCRPHDLHVLPRHPPRNISRPLRMIGNRGGGAKGRAPGEDRVNAQHARFRLRDARVSNDSACSSVPREPEKRGIGSRRGCALGRGGTPALLASQPPGKGRPPCGRRLQDGRGAPARSRVRLASAGEDAPRSQRRGAAAAGS